MKLTILIPAFNEERIIENTAKSILKFIDEYEPDSELLFVDDGSSDSTVKLIQKLAQKDLRVRCISHKQNMGCGAALRTGLGSAEGDVIVSLDCDLTYSFEDIPKLVETLNKENADIVIGSPYLKRAYAKEIQFHRFVLSRVANYIDKFIFGLNFTTPTSLFRAWRKNTAKNVMITLNGLDGIPESSINAFLRGYKIVEVPAYYHLKRKGTSSKIIRDTKRHLNMIRLVKKQSKAYKGG